MSVLFAISRITTLKREQDYPLIFDAPTSSFGGFKEDTFYNVIDNIDTYSIDDIEAKLSIICVRNKVSFDLDENNKNNGAPTVYNLNDNDDDANVPAWVKSLRETAKTM